MSKAHDRVRARGRPVRSLNYLLRILEDSRLNQPLRRAAAHGGLTPGSDPILQQKKASKLRLQLAEVLPRAWAKTVYDCHLHTLGAHGIDADKVAELVQTCEEAEAAGGEPACWTSLLWALEGGARRRAQEGALP